jgi:hypothetical protein
LSQPFMGYEIVGHTNQHPHWYLHLFQWGLSVVMFSPKNVGFELRDPDLVSMGYF